MVLDHNRRVLEKLGYAVVVAQSTPHALEVLASHALNASRLITDLPMPAMIGLELIDAVADRYRSMPDASLSWAIHSPVISWRRQSSWRVRARPTGRLA